MKELKEFMAKFALRTKNFFIASRAFVIRHRRALLAAAGVLAALRLLSLAAFYLSTDVFYYSHRLKPSVVVSDRRTLGPIPPESRLQAYVRQYITGGGSYQASLPYGGSERVVGIYHDKQGHFLTIDWEESFLRRWQEISPDRDTELFLKSLKKNFPVKTVRFLIQGRPAGLLWRGYRMDEGVPVEKISFK